MSRQTILSEIDAERDYQIQRWGDLDDLTNLPNDFVAYIAHYSTRWLSGETAPYSLETLIKYRQSMVKTAAIAVAATEFADKIINGENNRDDVLDSMES